MEKNKRSNRFSPEVRSRAVRMVLEHQQEYASQGAAISAIAPKIGCVGDTLRKWVRQEETDIGLHDGVTSDERERVKALEREVRELRQANEILRKASAYFAPLSAMLRIACRAVGRSSTAPSGDENVYR
jgi:transposase